MNEVFWGADAKIARAHELLKSLSEEAKTFVSQNPNLFTTSRGFTEDPCEYAFYVTQNAELPKRFAVLAGEIVHQLRSALDHLVVALAVGDDDPANFNLKDYQFPICTSRENFKNSMKKRLQGVKYAGLRRIVSVQPFRHEQPPKSLLYALQELNNRDKHRLLVIVGGAACLGEQIKIVGPQDPEIDVTITGLAAPEMHLLKLGTRQKVSSLYLATPAPGFDAEARISMTFGLGEIGPEPVVPLIPTLEEILNLVAHIVGGLMPE